MNRLSALLRWRHVRWLVCAALIPTVWACGARKLAPPVGGPSQVIKNRFQQSVNRKLDMLFLIDDSQSMAPLQQKMRDQMPTFMQRLAALPGGLPDLQVAVVSSSLGAGVFGNVNGCTPGSIGNLNGEFQHSALCTALPPDQHFLKSSGGPNPTNNFTGNIADVFNCIANLGAAGCGFEHQFEAVRLALQRALTPGDANQGFLRDGAYLAVIMLTNEDDCSVDAGSMLFDPNQQTLADPLGGLQSYRCNEFGHKCGGASPPHAAPADPGVTLQNCVSAEDGKLVTVNGFVDFLKSLKPGNPNQILVAAITGSPDQYRVIPHNFTLGNGMMEIQPQVDHSCVQQTAMGGAPEYADPAVRIKQFLDAFGNNATLQSICAPNYMNAMDRIAAVIGRALGAQCVQQNLQLRPNNEPDCDVTQRQIINSIPMDTQVVHCDGGRGTVPCWEFRPDMQCTMGTQLLKLCYNAACTDDAKPVTQTDALISCSIRP
ncbi:MAG: hypothetical protein ABUL67_02940 [Haliangium ochraceum]